MFCIRLQVIYCTYLLLLDIKFLYAQKGSTRINEDGVPNIVKSRFFDIANTGFSNFATGIGNLGSNYPTGPPFFPFGNQFPNSQRSQPNHGWGFQKQYPNQENFQRPQVGLNQGAFPTHRGVFGPGLNGIFDPASNTNQNKPRAFAPDNVPLLRFNRPQQNEGSYQPGQRNPGEALQFAPSNGNQIQNSNFAQDPNYYPNTRSQFPKRPINYPMENTLYPDDNRVYQNQNEYPARNNFLTRPKENTPPFTSDFPRTQNPRNDQGWQNVNKPVHSRQIPINQGTDNVGSNFNEGSYNAPQTMPKLPAQHVDSDATDPKRKVAILGKPVFVPPETTEANEVVEERLKKAVQKQCVQDCQTTSEYNPICGTNNVTYINPEKFACARNCGVDLYISRYGRCIDDPAFNYARQ